MAWVNKELQVYSDRTDLDETGFQLLCTLTVFRRARVNKDNAQQLWKEDQKILADYLAQRDADQRSVK